MKEQPEYAHECERPLFKISGGVARGLGGIAPGIVRSISGVIVPEDWGDDDTEWGGELMTYCDRYSSSDAGVMGYELSVQLENSRYMSTAEA
jgi:hypothetical protein